MWSLNVVVECGHRMWSLNVLVKCCQWSVVSGQSEKCHPSDCCNFALQEMTDASKNSMLICNTKIMKFISVSTVNNGRKEVR